MLAWQEGERPRMARLVWLWLGIATVTLFIPRIAAASCRVSDIYLSAAPARFEQRAGLIIDNVTGLMWQRCLLGLSGSSCQQGEAQLLNWPQALTLAGEDKSEGYSDWRLPNLKELASLVEYACTAPAMNETLFPNSGVLRPDTGLMTFIVWSATPYYDSGLIRYVDFSNAADNAQHRSTSQLVRLVRDL